MNTPPSTVLPLPQSLMATAGKVPALAAPGVNDFLFWQAKFFVLIHLWRKM
jgi:hypothetical protein